MQTLEPMCCATHYAARALCTEKVTCEVYCLQLQLNPTSTQDSRRGKTRVSSPSEVTPRADNATMREPLCMMMSRVGSARPSCCSTRLSPSSCPNHYQCRLCNLPAVRTTFCADANGRRIVKLRVARCREHTCMCSGQEDWLRSKR